MKVGTVNKKNQNMKESINNAPYKYKTRQGSTNLKKTETDCNCGF